ncbi:FAD-dependent oxidoreductase [Pseudooceanicola sp. CBS1P-1]|uniref:FAD-dependent oxidoreductase n=1 Tax=Pseudooceanicola albus TaxID=2692189 RepID=A0A6L7G9M2_9RHOB|nr:MULTISPECIES: FAD-dependent oxidoreductase [Pseudooceanicola]MBT9386247.1 FAD-dependent oxidoreductase [Pseudooceanicola endophyticus]MXN20297.1 FAD-dependent oxidoreductase [Pseudooceanicola albus]
MAGRLIPHRDAAAPKPQALRHAIVIGAGIAGLTAARALARHMDRVTLIETDRLGSGAEPRRRVPQAGHVHALLDAGRQALEALFPGLEETAQEQGAVLLPVRSRWRSHDGHDWSAPQDTGPKVLSQSRPALEALLRARVRALPGLVLQEGRVEGLVAGTCPPGHAPRITGVRLSGGARIAADLVIDATGRAGRGADWLAAAGFDRPPETRSAPRVRYASTLFTRADRLPSAWLKLASPPQTRGAVLAPIEGGRWIFTLTDRFGAAMPGDEAGLRAAILALGDGRIAALLSSERLLAPIRHFHIDTVRLRGFDSCPPPSGFLPLGDAIATYNPLHAQGMTAAILQASALEEALAGDARDAMTLRERYLPRAMGIARAAWRIGLAMDLTWPQFSGPADPQAEALARSLRAAFAASLLRPQLCPPIDRLLHLNDLELAPELHSGLRPPALS